MPLNAYCSREAHGMQERYGRGAATLADALADTSSERGSVSAGCGGATNPQFRADVDGGFCIGCRKTGGNPSVIRCSSTRDRCEAYSNRNLRPAQARSPGDGTLAVLRTESIGACHRRTLYRLSSSGIRYQYVGMATLSGGVGHVARGAGAGRSG